MSANLRTPNVRISPETHQMLRQLAAQQDSSMQAVLDKAVERYRRECFLRAANDDYLALRKNPRQWKAVLAERGIWDQTLGDGLGRE